MSTGRTKKSVIAFVVVMAAALLTTMLTPGSAEASASSSYGPCPNFSIYQVFADPNGDWDGDRIPNATELYNGLKPCVPDTTGYCTTLPWACIKAPVIVNPCSISTYSYYYGYYLSWTWSSVNANPNGDWDGDGVSNRTEAKYGADPCHRPCPNWSYIDVQLNPWADWDGDGQTNSAEVKYGTNPCNSASYYYVYVPRLPHVEYAPAPYAPAPYTPTPKPAPGYTCPVGYPYYHPYNGLCYANPV